MLPYIFVLLAIAVRFLPFAGPLNFIPHAWHFTPLAASLLFFGARGSRRQMWVPLVLMAAADVILTKYIYSYHLSWEQLIVWAWYAAILWLGTNLREKSGFWRVVGAAVASSISFFLISNFAAWLSMPGLYPRTFNGLMMSYTAGIPFFRNTAESDLFFSLAFFGTPVLVHFLSERMHKAGDHTAAA
jgi:phosphoglycerol transferase MdoB-like AlkP superfamily enzyme